MILAAPDSAGFDHAVAERFRSVAGQTGVRCRIHDLYAESFDPVLTDPDPATAGAWTRGASSEQIADRDPVDPLVDRHRSELAEAKALAIIHPDWFGKPPAILVGWIDRVLAPVVMDGHRGAAVRDRQLKRVLVVITGNSGPPGGGAGRDPLDSLWRQQVGPAVGTQNFEVLPFRPVDTADDEQHRQWLNGTARAAAWTCGADR